MTDAAGAIVLLPLLCGSALAAGVAPGLDEVGVMLPSTPLHHLLLEEVGGPLVMTSGNFSDEPICCDNEEAIDRLGGLVDLVLLHDRDIVARYDDSVIRPHTVVRAARGLTPTILAVPEGVVSGIALGAHLKNTFALVSAGRVLTSPHLGDLDNVLALENQAAFLAAYRQLFRVHPRAVACDLHPDYATTTQAEALAADLGVEPVRVQHHHAHIASVMAEHALRGAMVGVALDGTGLGPDGTGLGPDGTVWGGEVLIADEFRARRAGRIATIVRPLAAARFAATIASSDGHFADNAERLVACAAAMADRLFAGGRMLIIGGSAATTDAQHNAVEFVHPVLPGCRALPTISLCNDAAAKSTLLGGMDPEGVWTQQIETTVVSATTPAPRPSPALTL